VEPVTKKRAYVRANKVSQDKAVNYNAKINVTTTVAVLQKHLNVHYVIVNRASEVSAVKYKLAALLEKTKHVLEMAIASEANAIVTLALVA
jgi:heterodisulfide reductase subunit B